MKKHIAAILSALLFSVASSSATADNNVVLVELFTSQGCSSCPPADRNFATLAQREGVLGLSMHVDYWDYLGWRDTFARPEHTERQFAYRDLLGGRVVYTPQMIVQGTHDVAGARPVPLEAAIAKVEATPPPARITISDEAGMLKATLAADTRPEPCTVWIASFHKERTVEIARGENAGETLTYYNVVDKLLRVGQWDGTVQQIALPQPGPGGGVAIWLQEDSTGRILTASFVER